MVRVEKGVDDVENVGEPKRAPEHDEATQENDNDVAIVAWQNDLSITFFTSAGESNSRQQMHETSLQTLQRCSLRRQTCVVVAAISNRV